MELSIMNILVTLNSNYIHTLKVMLQSLFLNIPGETFNVYLMHSTLKEEELVMLQSFNERPFVRLTVSTIDNDNCADMSVVTHYSKEIYYRLLAYIFLPIDIDRSLYFDQDTLIINELHDLYHMDLSDYMLAGDYH